MTNQSTEPSTIAVDDDALVERVAEALWGALEGETHDGSEPWGSIAMEHSAPDVCARVRRLARAAIAAGRGEQ